MVNPVLRSAAPCFLVDDVFATAEHYRDVFGFCFEDIFGDPPSFVMLFRDGATIVLQQAPTEAQPSVRPNATVLQGTADVVIESRDVEALAGELRAKGADIVEGPVYRPIYDGWELLVRDRDGRLICFSQVDEPEACAQT